MNQQTRADLWQRLSDAGLAQGDVPAQSELPSPWFVRAMLGVAGWIGAMFLLGFVGAGLAFVFREESAAILVGLLCCGASYFIFAKGGRNELASQFGLAVSLAGQVMFIYGLVEAGNFDSGSPIFFILVAVFEGALAYFLASFVHRVWSAFAAAVAFGYALNMIGLYGVGAAAIGAALATIWLTERMWAARGSFWRAIGWGLVFAFVQPTSYLGDFDRWSRPIEGIFVTPWIVWIKSILVAAVLVYVVYRLLTEYDVAPGSAAGASALGASAAIGIATMQAPGISSSLIIVLLGFATGSRALFGFGILAMLSYLSYFYYSLEMTLLMKSFVLAGTGAVLVLLQVLMRDFLAPEGVKDGARA